MTFSITKSEAATKEDLYATLVGQLRVLSAGEHDFIANAANCTALLYQSLPDVNWVGFYLYKEGELVLGPFQGKPACVRIAMGRGVCGTAAQLKQTVVVEDVNEFPGHIACDSASNSEIVVPMIKDGRLVGVLDVDSSSLARFDEKDAQGLNELVDVFTKASGKV
jgi:GAF domain-containing protein